MARRDDYRRALGDVLRLADANEQQGRQAILAAIRDLRAQLADRVTRGDINAASITALLADVEALVLRTSAELDAIYAGVVRRAGELGADSVLNPLVAISAPITATRNLARLETVIGFTVELITGNLTNDMRVQIRRSLRLHAMGDLADRPNAMQEIDRILGFIGRGGPSFNHGILYDAERILRTETGRAFNLAAFDTLADAAQDDPNVKKRWVNPLRPTSRPTHIAVHMQTLTNPLPWDEPFIVDGEEMMEPLDPNASAGNTINCGCRMLTVYDDIGVVQMPGESRRLAMHNR